MTILTTTLFGKKKVIILLLNILFANFAFGQQLEWVKNQIWINESWENSILTTYNYNTSGTVDNYISETWDKTANKWVNKSKEISTYNSSGLIETSISQTWDTSKNNWINSTKKINSYLASLKVEKQEISNKLPIIPNLCENILYFNNPENKSVIIYGADGKIKFQAKNVTSVLNLAFLQKGVYLIRVELNNSVFSDKIIMR